MLRARVPMVSLVFIVLVPACGGGGSPTAPSTPAPPAPINVQTLDGWTGQPVSAAVSPSRPMPGATVTAVAGGYLPRVQPAAPQLYLWPGDEAYVRALVYGEFSPGGLLARWTRPFTVKPLADREDMTAATVAAAGAASGLGITTSGTGEVVLAVDPDALDVFSSMALAAAWRTFKGSTIVGCRIAVRRTGWATNGILLHELGHCLGLGHSPDSADLMFAYEHRATESFSDRELVLLRMMYRYRSPGNAAPDHEPGASAVSSTRTIAVVD